jgi:hypothetical protein
MATQNLGTLQAELNVDTSDLARTEREMRRTGNVIESEFREIDRAAQGTSRSFANVRNIAGQAGFQLQDVAVQAQMGTNAFVILGQQGSQFAGAFGPTGAIVGAVIAVGAAIATVLVPNLFESKSATEELEESLEGLGKVAVTTGDNITVLTEDIVKLAEKSEQAAMTAIRGGIVDGMNAVNASTKLASKAIGDDFDIALGRGRRSARNYSNALARTSKEFGITRGEVKEISEAFKEFESNRSAETLQDLQDKLDKAASSNVNAKDKFIELAQSIREFSTAAVVGQEQVDALKKAQEDLAGAIAKSNEELAKNQFSEAIAERRLEAIRNLGESEREEVERLATQRKEFLLTQDQITADERAALLENISSDRLSSLQDINNRELAAEERAADQKRRQRQKEFNESLEGMQALNDAAATLAASGSKEARKFAAVQAGISLAINVAKASEAGFPQNIPLIAGAIAQGIQIKSMLSKGGGRKHGGTTSGHLAHPINEAGVPEVLEEGGKQFLLPTGKGGKITPLGGSSSGGGGMPNITLINNGTPQTIESTRMSDDQIMVTIDDAVKSAKQEINTSLATGRGESAKSLKTGFRVEHKR